MKRNLQALAGREHDVVIVGGGIYGACAAWDAAQRGLTVALVERGDFSHATSAHHFKIVHGGVRYLQHGDLYRIRESSRERGILLRIAPHLVEPLRIVVPTYGHGLRSKGMLWAGLSLYECLVLDRNRGIEDPQRRIPRARILSKEECLRLFPGVDARKLTGAGMFCDAQIYNPPRLALSFLKSAVNAGAEVANYLEALGFLSAGDRVTGITVRDRLTGQEFEVRGRLVLSAAGPWAEKLLDTHPAVRLRHGFRYSRDACLIVNRRLGGDLALAVQARTSDPDAIVSRGRRHIFIAPWRDYTLIGVWHKVHTGDPGAIAVCEEEIFRFLNEVNAGYPGLTLTLGDVSKWNAGAVLFGENTPGATNLSFGKRSQLIDHAEESGIQGLITMIGVRATTARGVAERAIDLAGEKLGGGIPRSKTAVTAVHGGRIHDVEEFMRGVQSDGPESVAPGTMRALARNYGSEYREPLTLLSIDPSLGSTLGHSTVLRAEVLHAVREEMACTLADVVFRRTDLATGEYPGDDAMIQCAELMAAEAKWTKERVQRELEEVRSCFPRHVFRHTRSPSSGLDESGIPHETTILTHPSSIET